MDQFIYPIFLIRTVLLIYDHNYFNFNQLINSYNPFIIKIALSFISGKFNHRLIEFS